MKFSIKDFFCKRGRIPSFLWIWSHLLKKSIMENFIFWAVFGKDKHDFKNKQKSLWSNVFLWSNCFGFFCFFWYVKLCIFWQFVHYTLHWDKTQMSKKFPSEKINGTKNALFFLGAPTHHSFTFNLRFLYEMKHKVCLSKTVCGVFHFWLLFVFIKVYIFVRQDAWTLSLQNVATPFKSKIIEKPNTVLFPDLWFLCCKKKF